MDFAERLKTAMQLRGVRAAELSERSGINQGDISNYLSGKYKAKQDRVYTFAQILEVNPAWLMGYEVPMTVSGIRPPTGHHIPLVGAIAAGEPIFDEFVDEFVDTNINADCALIVRGNSMLPLYHDGDIVYIRECPEIAYNGQIAAVIVDDEATLKRVYKGAQIRLKSENSDYQDILINPAEKSVRILGKVVAFTRILHEE